MKVLVVDDFKPIRDFIIEVLRNIKDIEIMDTAGSESECLFKLNNLMPDVIFLDIEMEQENTGLLLSKKIIELLPKLKIIFMSGEVHSNLPKENTVSFLYKPFTAKDIITVIEKSRIWEFKNNDNPQKLKKCNYLYKVFNKLYGFIS